VKSSVFIKTYKPDLKWLEWSLRFLNKNWKTESEFVICSPNDCADAVKGMTELLGHEIHLACIDQWGEKGYLHQQYMKMQADVYCSGDFITFIDSDAMLVMPTDLDRDLCVDGKPIIWYTHYSKIHTPWQRIVSKIMSLQPQHEYMRCMPITYHRSTLKGCREHLEKMHGMILETLIRDSSIGWTEFNVMGFYAKVFQPDLYTWKSTDEMFLQENKEHHWHDRVRQFHNVIDWHERTASFLADLYGEPIKESPIREGRVVQTPAGGQQALIDKILPYIKEGSFAIDVGAHRGLHSLAYSKAGAKVLAFEPNAESFTALWRALHGKGTAFAFAVSDHTGKVIFKEDKDCSEASYVSEKGESVPCVSLDDLFLKNKSIKAISVLKIDVEGYEPFVLRGAAGLIDEFKPVIAVECQKQTLERNGFTRKDIEGFLEAHGYRLEISTTDPRATLEGDYFFDIIACPI
jgi:FkbM family methyltransferase